MKIFVSLSNQGPEVCLARLSSARGTDDLFYARVMHKFGDTRMALGSGSDVRTPVLSFGNRRTNDRDRIELT